MLRHFTLMGILLAAPVVVATSALAKPAKSEKVRTGIEWAVTPAEVEVFLNGKKLGKAGDLRATGTKPGRHTIRLVKGGDETEVDVQVNQGQLLRFVLDFSE